MLGSKARVAGTQFERGGLGFVLSGDGADHRSMATGELWAYNATTDSWAQLPPHPGPSRWAPASFVLDGYVHLYGGLERRPGCYEHYPDTAFRVRLDSIL